MGDADGHSFFQYTSMTSRGQKSLPRLVPFLKAQSKWWALSSLDLCCLKNSCHDWCSRPRSFAQGQAAMVRDFCSNTSNWRKGVAIQQLGPVTYTVEVEGKLLKRHVHLPWLILQVRLTILLMAVPLRTTSNTQINTLSTTGNQQGRCGFGWIISLLSSSRQATSWSTYLLNRLLFYWLRGEEM